VCRAIEKKVMLSLNFRNGIFGYWPFWNIQKETVFKGNEMIKRIATYSLPEGTDGDEFFKYHTEIHAADVLNAAGAGLKKYVISRVTKIVRGKQQFFGIMEQWWESEAAMNKGMEILKSTKLPNGKSVVEDFTSRVMNDFSAVVEEFIVKE
jgi:hypothetical protein